MRTNNLLKGPELQQAKTLHKKGAKVEDFLFKVKDADKCSAGSQIFSESEMQYLRKKYPGIYSSAQPNHQPVIKAYMRYSCEKQHDDGEIPNRETTIIVQEQYIRKFCFEKWHATLSTEDLFVDEAMSGALLERAAWKRLLKLIRSTDPGEKSSVDVVACFDSSRLLRGYAEFQIFVQECQARGIRAYEVSSGFELTDDNMISYSLAMAFVRDMQRRETSRVSKHHAFMRARNGLHTGGRVYGYRSMKVENGRILTPEPEESRVVVDIFRWRANGCSIRSIAAKLNELGIASPNDSRYGWSVATVGRILQNEKYKGILAYGITKCEPKRIGFVSE